MTDTSTRLPVRLIALVVAILAAGELVAHFVDSSYGVVAIPVAALVVTVVALRSGITWDELGLARSTWSRGARYALVLAGAVTVVVAVMAAIPAFRSVFEDDRYDTGIGRALVVALVLVPLRTVIPEELAFRGVLLAMLTRRFGTTPAVIGSSVLFGLWHVTSSVGLAADNEAVGSVASGAAAQWIGVIGAVVATTLAGVVLCVVRLRSGSLIAPIALHWAVNGVGVLASAVVLTITT